MNVRKSLYASVFAIGILLISSSNSSALLGWQIERIVHGKSFSDMRDRTIAIDGNGVIHITYGGDHLYYAYYDGIDWHYEVFNRSNN